MSHASVKKFGDICYCFENCKSVHTFGMRFSLDIAFFDQNGIVLDIRRNVRPLSFVTCSTASPRHCTTTLERPHKPGLWLMKGDKVRLLFSDQKTET
ncbi:MAG: DUF192 domain-containing protein [Coriobacteriales bacterium]|nr:DUF192 domain-containing protein [Coriobacteriales bacterium]